MKNTYLIGIIIVGIIMVVAFVLISRASSDESNNTPYENNSVQPAESAPLNSQTSSEGAVTVTARPIDQSDWSFEVELNTHSVDLSEDLMQAVVLLDENGKEYAPIEWEGDPPGGHHRKGVLRFGKIVPAPQSIVLRIRQIGGVNERKFEWIVGS